MFSTRSPSRAAPVTDLVLVSHGSPSDPAPQEEFIRQLAEEVGAVADISVRGATLAAKGALEAAVEGLDNPMIFPHFMADGWFVSTNLPRRLEKTGLARCTMLSPLGLLPALVDLALENLKVADGKTLVIAAHGSPSDPRPARATEQFAKTLAASNRFATITIGYVDENPKLGDALCVDGAAVVLPFFAAKAGHILMDLPEAIEASGYSGPVLEPIGTWDGIAKLIAENLPVTSHKKADAA